VFRKKCSYVYFSRWRLLFASDEVSKIPSFDDFDAVLIYWFLQHVCNLPRPSNRIWKWKPTKNDVTETADVTRFRDFRNFVVNATTHALFDDEFERKVTEITEVVS